MSPAEGSCCAKAARAQRPAAMTQTKKTAETLLLEEIFVIARDSIAHRQGGPVCCLRTAFSGPIRRAAYPLGKPRRKPFPHHPSANPARVSTPQHPPPPNVLHSP